MNFLFILTLIIGYFVYLTYKPYLLDIAIASLLAIAMFQVEFYLSKFIKNRYLLSSISTLILTILILGPIIYFIGKVGILLTDITPETISFVINKAKSLLNYLPNTIALKLENFLSIENIQKIYSSIAPIVATITTKSANFIKDTFLIIIFFFFASLYGRDILLFFKKVIPIEDRKLESLYYNMSEVMSVVFYSTILTALLEGVLFGLIVSFYGFNFLFFSIMYAFSSLIPVIGGVIMWLPLALYMYAKGDINGAIVISIYSIVVISIIADTFIKPLIIAKVKDWVNSDTELNSILIFFSIVAGLSSFGLWGIIIGPAVTALFISVLKFYKKVEYI